MKTNQELYSERLTRIKKAIAVEKPDQTPVILLTDMFAPAHMGVKLADYVSDIKLAANTVLASTKDLKDVDGIQGGAFNPELLSTMWMSKIKMPGRELGDNDLWQVAEQELIQKEDYDTILNGGWTPYMMDFFEKKLDNLFGRLAPSLAYMPVSQQMLAEAGYVVTNNGPMFTIPYEMLCGGRTMVKFMRDLFSIPDKVEAVMDVIAGETLANVKNQAANIPAGLFVSGWVGGWRSASQFVNPRLWERFVWKYMKPYTDTALELGITPIFHMDSDWERDLPYFKSFPKGKCIFMPDAQTNIYKIKEVLGDTMCILGDVSPTLLTIGTAEETYEYSRKLIKDMGLGYILGQGCDIPQNAKVENVKAMIAAATGK